MVEKVFLQRRKVPSRVAEHPYCLDSGERLGGIVSNVLSKEQLSIEVEA